MPVNRYFPKIVFSSFPASENIMANFTESISPSTTDSIVSSQLGKISASLSLTPSPPLSLATSASAFAELTIQSDFVSSSFSSYLSQDASSSVNKSLTFFRRVSRFSFKKQTCKAEIAVALSRRLSRNFQSTDCCFTGVIGRKQFDQ